MVLPAPNLDDRKFQDIVDEEDVKKLYQVRAIILADLSVPPHLTKRPGS